MRKKWWAMLTLCLAPAVWAAPYTEVVPAHSEIRFQYKQMGVAMDGRFTQFKGQLSFDPAQPDQGKATIEVPLSGVDAGSDEADEELTGTDWFHTADYPVARFETQAIDAASDGGYTVQGMLTIKGKSVPMTIPARFSMQDGLGVFEGRFTILRGDFDVGAGAWSAFDIVANEIAVEFRIAAKP